MWWHLITSLIFSAFFVRCSFQSYHRQGNTDFAIIFHFNLFSFPFCLFFFDNLEFGFKVGEGRDHIYFHLLNLNMQPTKMPLFFFSLYTKDHSTWWSHPRNLSFFVFLEKWIIILCLPNVYNVKKYWNHFFAFLFWLLCSTS